MAEENTNEQPASETPAEPAGGQPAQQPQAPAQPAEGAQAAPARARKDMTPEERAAAIKAAQERALRMKAERDAAKAAAAGTAVAPAAEAVPGAPAAPAGPVWRISAAGPQQVVVARPEDRTLVETERAERQVRVMIKRRQALRGGVFASLGGFVILLVGSFLNFFNPRHITGFGGVVRVPASAVPKPGADPVKIFAGKFWLVNLKPGEGGSGAIPGSDKGGLIALYQKCPHLGCTVPWRSDFEFLGSKGWFRCPCHGSTYTIGGLKVAGPAPRSMDTMLLTPNSDGSVTVNSGKITLGSNPADANNDPQRALPT